MRDCSPFVRVTWPNTAPENAPMSADRPLVCSLVHGRVDLGHVADQDTLARATT